MNCKPGDLAVIKPPQTCGYCHLTGRIVEVIGPLQTNCVYPDAGPVFHHYEAEPGEWLCKLIGGTPKVLNRDDGWPVFTMYTRMWDSRLRPIRDPGDDAQDETLSWLPVPTTEGVPA